MLHLLVRLSDSSRTLRVDAQADVVLKLHASGRSVVFSDLAHGLAMRDLGNAIDGANLLGLEQVDVVLERLVCSRAET